MAEVRWTPQASDDLEAICLFIARDSPQLAATRASKRGRGGVFENAAETTGSAGIGRDNGFSAWFDARLKDFLDCEIGYNRSVHYDLNAVPFAVGFNLGHLISKGKRH